MRGVVSIMVAAATLASAAHAAEPAVDGKEVYRRWCASCHAPGDRHPGMSALQAKYNGQLSPILLERRDLDPDVVRTFVRNGITIMPSFRKTEISDAELDALAAYITHQPMKTGPARKSRK